MAAEIVADHVELARDFLERSKFYLAQGDLHQASEKGWGAASHIIKAVAAANNWEYERHDDFDSVVINARQRYRQPSLAAIRKLRSVSASQLLQARPVVERKHYPRRYR